MSLTLIEVCDKLKEIDEITLLETLDITSEDIVVRFVDVIEDNFDRIEKDLTADDE